MQHLQDRTKRFAVDVITLCAGLPHHEKYRIVGKQLMRSASSVGANYRACCRVRSRRDFVAKLSIVEEEADESMYWLELLQAFGDLGTTLRPEVQRLHREANELVAITVASKKTARGSA